MQVQVELSVQAVKARESASPAQSVGQGGQPAHGPLGWRQAPTLPKAPPDGAQPLPARLVSNLPGASAPRRLRSMGVVGSRAAETRLTKDEEAWLSRLGIDAPEFPPRWGGCGNACPVTEGTCRRPARRVRRGRPEETQVTGRFRCDDVHYRMAHPHALHMFAEKCTRQTANLCIYAECTPRQQCLYKSRIPALEAPPVSSRSSIRPR